MFWEELTGDRFEQAKKEAQGVCLLPLSCLERHAHHLPLGTDLFIVRELCRRATALEPAIVFPDFIFSQILEARHCQGTIAVEIGLILRLLDNTCREIARNGLPKIALVSHHGGNSHLLSLFAQSQLASRKNYVVYVADPPLPLEEEKAIAAQWETQVDGHAGESETSMLLSFRPDLVDGAALRAGAEGMPLGRLDFLGQAGVYSATWWYADHPSHYRGDAGPAKAEKGERQLEAQARALACSIRAIKRDDVSGRLQAEFFDASENP